MTLNPHASPRSESSCYLYFCYYDASSHRYKYVPSAWLAGDSVFDTQKILESRQAACKFLPREDLASGTKISGQDTFDNSVPLFEQVRTPRIEQDAESQVQRMCSEYISQQLIGHIIAAFSRQLRTIKYLAEVAILLDSSGILDSAKGLKPERTILQKLSLRREEKYFFTKQA